MTMQKTAICVATILVWFGGPLPSIAQKAQSPVGGFETATIHISADGEYTWKLDKGVDQGLITPAKGVDLTVIAPGQHGINFRSEGKHYEYDINNAVAGKSYSIKVVATMFKPDRVPHKPDPGKSSEDRTGSESTPAPADPTTPTNPPAKAPIPVGVPSTDNPDMFVRIQTRTHPERGGSTGLQVMVIAIPFGGTHYDERVQMVMKDVGSSGKAVELADFLPGTVPHAFTGHADELGKEAVICYTAHAASQPAQRWTQSFHIQSTATPGMAALTPAEPPTLVAASDAPCGGITVVKAPPAPTMPTGLPAHASAPTTGSGTRVNPVQVAVAHMKGVSFYNQKRYDEARPQLVQACEQGDMVDACNALGYMYQLGLGVKINYNQAREYYLKACDDDSSLSCSNLGTLYQRGLGVTPDDKHALSLFEQGCDAYNLEGCEWAGQMYMNGGTGVPKDNAQALERFKKACDGELAAGCGDEGYMYTMGLGVKADKPYGASLFKRGCEMGSPNSCFSMGMAYRGGDGVPRDAAKSREYFGRGCSLGDKDSCGYVR
jgi:hypothetical protein